MLWAQNSALPSCVPRRPGRTPRVREHPYALDAHQLATLLNLSSRVPPAGFTGGSAVLALPTRGRGPVPPPELLFAQFDVSEADSDSQVDSDSVADSDVGRADDQPELPTTLASWRVPTIELDPDAAWGLLPTLGGGALASSEADSEGSFVLLGSDVARLRELANFAKDLVGRGRVLPTVQSSPDGRGAEARWRPVTTGPDAIWLRTFLGGLPLAATAEVDAKGQPIAGPIETVVRATDALVDAAVRSALGPPTSRSRRRRTRRTWHEALTGTDRAFEASAQEVADLAAALRDWQADATVGGAARACFRLIEPEAAKPEATAPAPAKAGPAKPKATTAKPAKSGPTKAEPTNTAPTTPQADWRVEFALQASDEPSLIVDASRIWRARGSTPALARQVPNPQETLLAELGRAVRLYPGIEPALRTAKPDGVQIDAAGAHSFLAETAPILMAAGFGVVLPGWWTNPTSRLGTRLRASTPSQPGSVNTKASIGESGLVDFQWELALGDQALTDDEIARLLDDQQPLVQLRGQWMLADTDRLRNARAFLRRQQDSQGQMTVLDVLHTVGSEREGPGGLPVLGVDAEGWLADLLSSTSEQRVEPVSTPATFQGVLRPYQQRGLSWLAFLESIGMGGLLADDMGLGKTVQLLALISKDAAAAEQSGHTHPTLLVCPMSLVGNWQREATRFTPELQVHVHHGAERPRGVEFEQAVAQSDMVITTYSLLVRDADALQAIEWQRVVLDEAQAIKNSATKAAIAARSIPARRRIAVTGTPVENRLADLWSLMEFANPGILGTATDFKNRFATPIEKHGDEPAGVRLRAITQPFVLRRLKTDKSIITDLPDKLEMEVVCSLTKEQAGLYQGVVNDMLEQIEQKSGIERRGLILATMTKLKQVCNHPAQYLHDGSRLAGRSGKLARLEETLDEVLAAGDQAIMFTQYAEFGNMVRSHLTARFGREVAFLHGGVSRADRDAMVARFQSGDRSGAPLMVLSLKAGGTGLTLTAANHVIHLDRWWNPAVEDQATDRAFRIGQTRSVQVRKFVCAGTLEEKIAAMIRDKRGLAAKVVGTGESWLTELSTAQLRELVRLESGSVVE